MDFQDVIEAAYDEGATDASIAAWLTADEVSTGRKPLDLIAEGKADTVVEIIRGASAGLFG